jgi:hypothetical protein
MHTKADPPFDHLQVMQGLDGCSKLEKDCYRKFDGERPMLVCQLAIHVTGSCSCFILVGLTIGNIMMFFVGAVSAGCDCGSTKKSAMLIEAVQ